MMLSYNNNLLFLYFILAYIDFKDIDEIFFFNILNLAKTINLIF